MVQVLVAIDDSTASERAVEYVGRLLADRYESRLKLLHVLTPVPAGLLDFEGARSPQGDWKVDEEFEQAREKWLRQGEVEYGPIFDRLAAILSDLGVPDGHVSRGLAVAGPGDSVGRVMVREAKQHGCNTIAVGRGSLPWYEDMFHRHVSTDLVREAEGLTVWVVE
jgi:nucleotide-binding universal stress UspA family protein